MQDNENGAGVRFVEVSDRHDGQRIDNFLLHILKGVPKSRIYRILRRGEVRVNRGRIRPDHRLQAGDRVRLPPVRTAQPQERPKPPAFLLAQLKGAVLLEDDRVLVLDKPSGLAVHGGSGQDFGIIEVLRALRPEAPFLELAHRLDRETSGCLVIAKSPTALGDLHHSLRERSGDKRYLALLRGRLTGPCTVEAPLRKNVLRGGERLVAVDPDGKPATTRFTALQHYGEATLVEAAIETGRTHQIRVHARHLGHPLAGDGKYGDEGFNRRMALLGLKRLFLHAHSLTLPLGPREVTVSAPLETSLRRVLDRLEGQQ
ncbi:MAG: RluA family pseudouridine synthase [Candidatus Competibacteraceae bacterium]|nr:RluA family pseudouridine synthase [Candidatus Competibacteraceae bacterium]